MLQFHYEVVTITGGWHHIGEYPFSMEYTVVGDGGVAEYSSAGRPPKFYAADGKCEALAEPEMDWYGEEIRYFLDCCIAGTKPVECAPEESARAVKLTLLMLESRKRKGEKLPCNL